MTRFATLLSALALFGFASPVAATSIKKDVTGVAQNKKKNKAKAKAKEEARKKCKKYAADAHVRSKSTRCIKLGKKHKCFHTVLCKYADAGSVTVRNCSDSTKVMGKYKYKATVCVYNSGDSIRTSARHRRTMIPGRVFTARCKGDRGRFCKVSVTKEAGNACPVIGKIGKKRTAKVLWGRTLYIRVGDQGKLRMSKSGCPSAF